MKLQAVTQLNETVGTDAVVIGRGANGGDWTSTTVFAENNDWIYLVTNADGARNLFLKVIPHGTNSGLASATDYNGKILAEGEWAEVMVLYGEELSCVASGADCVVTVVRRRITSWD